ncbi:sulfotransferase family 2 domain-containing protein [Roseovarius atlanticus]|uniref:sulfotransferase family 2 domain-containing protein n=1 Tax=Roseovarius atlanticus TaxID=1641875 RepID=UPI001C97402C|nr:sulfotransferase family 2 domain-containing protein [Roseovarius atlanticus]MBY6127069.1 sulfotransferase family protein [Roseovarius atlanticus]MBY6151563.1 sulfotransferase family protein [Roseovarius atlanticus]
MTRKRKADGMSLTEHEIKLAYQLFLGRQPSALEAGRMLANQTSLDGLRRVFLNSDEFRSGMLRPGDGGRGKGGAGVPPSRRTLIHLHIPKSAGSSLSRLLIGETRPNERVTIGDNAMAPLHNMPPERLKGLKLIFGHLSHGIAAQIPHRCHYISVLRQPGPRILSFYRYVERTDHHPLYKTVTGQKMSFGDFLEFTAANPQFRMEVDNGQVRRLAGSMQISDLGRERALLRRALHHVFAPNFTYGLTDRFDNFQKRLVKQGLLSTHTPIRENAAPEPGRLEDELDELSPTQREIYNGYIAWDNQLYDICQSVYFSGKTADTART